MKKSECGSWVGMTLWAVAMGFSAAGAVLLFRFMGGLPLAAKIGIIAVPLVPSFFFIRSLMKGLKAVDELQLRIHMEAAATGTLGIFIAACIYPVARMAGLVGELQPHYVIFTLVGFVFLGYINAIRRYR